MIHSSDSVNDQESLQTLPGEGEEDDEPLLDCGPAQREVAGRGPRQKTGCRARCPITVEPTMVMYFMAMSCVKPLTQQLVYARVGELYNATDVMNQSCNPNVSDPGYQLEQKVQAISSEWLIGFDVAMALPAMVTTLFMGSYSDRGGRKVAMVAPIVAAIVRAAWSVMVLLLKWPLATLLVGAFIEGVSGAAGTFTMACFASIADITATKNRPIRIVIIELCSAIGVALSQVGTGYMLQLIGYTYSFVVTGAVYILAAIYTCAFVYETVEKEVNVKFFTITHIRSTLQLYLQDNGTGRRGLLWLLLIVLSLAFMAEVGSLDSLTLTLLGTPLCWTSINIGYFLATSVLVRNFGSLATARLLVRRVHGGLILAIACASGIGYFCVLCIANTKAIIYIAPLVGLCAPLVVPISRTLGSKLVEPNEQGAVFSGISWIQGISVMVGAVGVNSIYSATVGFYHGFTFLVLACLYGLALMLALVLYRRIVQHEKATSDDRVTIPPVDC